MISLVPYSIAPLLARVMLGILFVFQGYDKIFKIKISNVIETIKPSYYKFKFPHFLFVFIAGFTSYIEFCAGLFLTVGFMKYVSLYFLGIDLLIVSFGMSIINPVWNMDLVFPRFLILLFLLVYPAEYDTLTVDNLLIYLNKF